MISLGYVKDSIEFIEKLKNYTMTVNMRLYLFWNKKKNKKIKSKLNFYVQFYFF